METKPDITSVATGTIPFAEFPSFIRTKAFSEKNIFCIIDAAAEGTLYPLLKYSDWEYRCLYKKGVHYKGNRMSDALAAAAPYLLVLDPDKIPVKHFVDRRLGKHQLILFQADGSINDLKDHFSGLLKAMDEDGNVLNFRFYDPRILGAYLPTCTEEEKKYFFGPAQVFWTEDGKNGMLEFSRKIEAPSEKKSTEPSEKNRRKPESGFGIFSDAKTPDAPQEDSLAGYGMIGQFPTIDGK
jgi:hypothetical protein